MRVLGIAAFCTACSLGLSAQQGPTPVRNDTMHLTVNTSISASAVKPGDTVSLTFNVTPKRNMHVYAPGKHDYQVIAVKIDPQPWLRAR